MPGFLEPIWETVFRLATWAALVFGAVSIGSAFVSAWVGWEITDATQKDADKKIKAADEKIAEFNSRAMEAELKLERLRQGISQRHIKGERFLKILAGKPKATVEMLFNRDDGEAFQLALEIRDWLKQASWVVEEPRPIAQSDLAPRLAASTPSTMAAGGQPQGVSVFLRAESQADFARETEKNPLDSNELIDTARKALSRALMDSLGAISGGCQARTGAPECCELLLDQNQRRKFEYS